MSTLSIIIPAYNEARTIHLILDKVREVKLNFDIQKEIIIVNDCSSDNTQHVIEEYISKNNAQEIRLHKHEVNQGKGAAIHNGIKLATGDYIIVQDADLEYDPNEYNVLLKSIIDGFADVVYGSRFMGGNPHRVLFFWHTIGNKILTMLSNMFTNLNLTDMETCYKVFRSEFIKQLDLKEKRFGFEPEVTAKISRVPKVRIYEVGISYYGRTYEEGKKIGWKDGFRALWCIMKYNVFQEKKKETLLTPQPKSSKLFFWLLCLLFLIVASLQSLVPHYEFYSNNMDLGFHNQLIYKFAHFSRPSSTLWNPQYELKNCFGDHFTLLMPLNAQLYWIFGSYTLLVCQILYCLIGALGIYKLISSKYQSYNLALAGVFLFFTHYSLYSALDFDAHDNVYGMMFLPWILYYYHKLNYKAFIASLLIFLIARDDLALTGIFLGISLLIFDWKKGKKFAITCLLISLSYFIIVFLIIMPPLSPVPWGYSAWRFNALGKNIPEVFHTIITKPFYSLSIFTDTIEKQQKIKFFLMTGGVLAFIKPRYILIFLPTFLVTCLSDGWTLWGNMYHYNIIFAVLLPILITSIVSNFRIKSVKYVIIGIAFFMNLHYLEKNYFHDWSAFNRIFTSSYYNKRDNQSEIKEALNIIPKSASVSAANHLTPHLAFREKIYCFPDFKDAEYIAINEEDEANDFYPFLSPDEFKESVIKIRKNKDYNLIFDKNEMLLFKKNN